MKYHASFILVIGISCGLAIAGVVGSRRAAPKPPKPVFAHKPFIPLTKPQLEDAVKQSGIKFDFAKLMPLPVRFSLDAEHPFNSTYTASLNGIAWFCCSHVENDIEVMNPGQGFVNVWFQGANPSKNYLVTFNTVEPVGASTIQGLSGKTDAHGNTYSYNAYAPVFNLTGQHQVSVVIPAGSNTAELALRGGAPFWIFEVYVQQL